MRQQTIKFLRTTKANLDAQKAINNLIVGEPYSVTDTNQFAIADTVSNYTLYYNASEVQTALDGKINNYTRSTVSTLTIDCSTADIFEVTLTANTSFSITNVPTNKDKAFEILNNSGAEITITLPTSQFWESQTVKIGAGKIKEFTVRSNGTRQVWHTSSELKNA